MLSMFINIISCHLESGYGCSAVGRCEHCVRAKKYSTTKWPRAAITKRFINYFFVQIFFHPITWPAPPAKGTRPCLRLHPPLFCCYLGLSSLNIGFFTNCHHCGCGGCCRCLGGTGRRSPACFRQWYTDTWAKERIVLEFLWLNPVWERNHLI